MTLVSDIQLCHTTTVTARKRRGRPSIFKKPTVLNVKLEAVDRARLIKLAEERDTTASGLAREWILAALKKRGR